MISKDKRKPSKGKSLFKNQYEQEQNILHEVLTLIDQLFEMRLVQRISRPIEKKIKEDYISKYLIKIQLLHSKLTKIRTQVVQNTTSQTGNPRNKSVFGEATNKPDDWKKVIRNIQNRYSEVLIDGSFKHFKKIAYFLGLTESSSMSIINIQQWAAACLDTRSGGICC